jgi:hypothetical protein
MQRVFSKVAAVVAVTCAIAALLSPALSFELKSSEPGKAIPYISSVENGGNVPGIGRGEMFEVACSDAGRFGAEVRVVMQFDPAPGETATGYVAVLATEQFVSSGKVFVQVPDVPNIANHTMDVKVFVISDGRTHSCDAGRIKVF